MHRSKTSTDADESHSSRFNKGQLCKDGATSEPLSNEIPQRFGFGLDLVPK
jgi:hypothetical protein